VNSVEQDKAPSGADDVVVSEAAPGIMLLEIDRPPHNFVDDTLLGRLADALEELAAQDSCRAVVVAGRGKHFCAGVDFSASRGDITPEEQLRNLYREALRIFEQPLPLIAAVHGAAVGAGLGLALAADFRLCTPAARFAANFARLGFHQGFGLSITLPRVVGNVTAADLLYTGRRVSGTEAARIGLCERVVALEDVIDESVAFAKEIAASAPLAVRAIRSTLRADLTERVRTVLEHERTVQLDLQQTADWREGVRAMAQRRPPQFEGR
jgi:2-(1,2-epoxy-1,2-dihydrophenyl)acetyl-CoA isomerase